jgi:hypothetical protein
MTDFTIEIVQQCESLNPYHKGHVGGYSQYLDHEGEVACTCKAYQFSKSKVKTCKHIKQFREEQCGWHGMYDEVQTPEQESAKICPRCGGSTEYVRVAV